MDEPNKVLKNPKIRMKNTLRKAFSLHGDTADYDVIEERILSGGEVKGTNLCILVLAALIASVGLNMNSTAVIIGATRKEKSNVIPGVAIATALMPPICTAAYGLASGNIAYFLGAMYLFLINAYFICLTSLIVLLLINIPKRSHLLNAEKMKKLKKRIMRNSIM